MTVTARPLDPSDRRAVAFVLRHLGEHSRYTRFLSAQANLDRETGRLLDTDHWHHETVIAQTASPRVPIGVADYVRLVRFDAAELAVTVVDDWQRHGVGRLLTRELAIRARAAGIRTFVISISTENRGGIALAGRIGAMRVVGRYGTTVDLEVAL